MPKRNSNENQPMQRLRKIALGYPEVEEGTSCDKSAFKARNKAFLFLGTDGTSYNVMLKLNASLPEAARLSSELPEHYVVGVHGWVTIKFQLDESPPSGLLEKWIDESFRLLAPKKLVALLSGGRV